MKYWELKKEVVRQVQKTEQELPKVSLTLLLIIKSLFISIISIITLFLLDFPNIIFIVYVICLTIIVYDHRQKSKQLMKLLCETMTLQNYIKENKDLTEYQKLLLEGQLYKMGCRTLELF